MHFVRAVRDLRPLLRSPGARTGGWAGESPRERGRMQRTDENEPIGRPGQPATTRGVAATAKPEGGGTEERERAEA